MPEAVFEKQIINNYPATGLDLGKCKIIYVHFWSHQHIFRISFLYYFFEVLHEPVQEIVAIWDAVKCTSPSFESN